MVGCAGQYPRIRLDSFIFCSSERDFIDSFTFKAPQLPNSNFCFVHFPSLQLCEQPSSRSKGYNHADHAAAAAATTTTMTFQSIRANVVYELVTAERDYVKLLNDLVDGYLKPMRSRPDLFSSSVVNTIFGNLEEIYQFQKRFLVNLEHSLNENRLEDSVVGNCFISHVILRMIMPLMSDNHVVINEVFF